MSPKISIVLGLFALAILLAWAKVPPSAMGIGISPTVTQCPAGIKGFAMLCPVGSGGTFQMYVSYDGNPYTVLP